MFKVTKWLQEGARIGCIEEFRSPSRATNTKDAILEGEKVTDAICDWVKKGVAYGPVDIKDIPKSAKVSGME